MGSSLCLCDGSGVFACENTYAFCQPSPLENLGRVIRCDVLGSTEMLAAVAVNAHEKTPLEHRRQSPGVNVKDHRILHL